MDNRPVVLRIPVNSRSSSRTNVADDVRTPERIFDAVRRSAPPEIRVPDGALAVVLVIVAVMFSAPETGFPTALTIIAVMDSLPDRAFPGFFAITAEEVINPDNGFPKPLIADPDEVIVPDSIFPVRFNREPVIVETVPVKDLAKLFNNAPDSVRIPDNSFPTTREIVADNVRPPAFCTKVILPTIPIIVEIVPEKAFVDDFTTFPDSVMLPDVDLLFCLDNTPEIEDSPPTTFATILAISPKVVSVAASDRA
jgi:hypothetical protein